MGEMNRILHTLGGRAACIDVERTAAIYASLPAVGDADSAGANFLWNLRQRKTAILSYFQPLGIAPEKCRNLGIIEVNAEQQSVWYAGEYPMVGVLLNPPEEDDDFSETVTRFGFRLGFTEEDGQLTMLLSVNFPWVFSPPIPTVQYINKTRLPETFQMR